MKKFLKYISIPFAAWIGSCSRPAERPATAHPSPDAVSIYSFKMKDLSGNEIDFKQYQGKNLLLVNTASHCGYTHQYKELQKLSEEYKDKVVVLGFPSNDFAGQEPGSREEIREFCTKNYSVTFQLFDKIHVKGKSKASLYSWLSDKSQNGWNDQEPTWNFCKYLVGPTGELIGFYPSRVSPMDESILSKLK
ncbi:MAG: glutathione peroxidase [Bacteroidia bacterium]